MGITPGAVTQLVSRLRNLRLVDIITLSSDARVRVISLTPVARADVDPHEKAHAAGLAPLFDRLTTAGLAQLAELLAKRHPAA